MAAIEVRAAPDSDVTREDVEAAREQAAALTRYAGSRDLSGRIVLRRPGRHGPAAHLANATIVFAGRTLAAHATGATPAEAIGRLARQMRRTVGTDIAMRHEARVIDAALEQARGQGRHDPQPSHKPPQEREIVHRRTYAQEPEPTLTAIADLLDLDLEFHLFVHARTGEDVVVHWRDDRRIALLFPRGSVLADEADIVVPEPSRYSDPLSFDAARAEMDLLNHRFLYFADAADLRGKALYLRFDGDYGLVEPG
jgi:hypothetical protein